MNIEVEIVELPVITNIYTDVVCKLLALRIIKAKTTAERMAVYMKQHSVAEQYGNVKDAFGLFHEIKEDLVFAGYLLDVIPEHPKGHQKQIYDVALHHT